MVLSPITPSLCIATFLPLNPIRPLAAVTRKPVSQARASTLALRWMSAAPLPTQAGLDTRKRVTVNSWPASVVPRGL